MDAQSRPRFSIAKLSALAGDKVFARGVAYETEGRVEILANEPRRVLARVAGEDDYRVELFGGGEAITGRCTCPAFADWGFCKHLVATALVANAAGDPAAGTDAGPLARIREHLRRQDIDALVAMIVNIAEHDPALWRRLDRAAAVADEDDAALEARLAKAIDQATYVEHAIGYGEAADWAAEIDDVLDAINGVAKAGRHALALNLVLRAIEGIEEGIEQVDNSEGECSGLLDRARDIHLAATRALRPKPVALAQELFARETQSDFDTFSGAAWAYADVLGDAGRAEYRRLALEAWDRLPPRSGRAKAGAEIEGDYRRLAGILDGFLESDGDVEARIALRAKDLSTPWDYLRLAEFCLAHGRDDEALRRVEEGLWLFEDDRAIQRLETFAVGLFSKVNRKSDAEALLERMFKRAPSFELYLQIGQYGAAAVRERALESLRAGLVTTTATRWRTPADLLVRILTHDRAFHEAWAVVRQHGVSAPVKRALAEASEQDWPREALEVYAEQVELLANIGGGDYAEAARLIARMAGLRGAAEQSAYLADVKVRHARKRNLMKLL